MVGKGTTHVISNGGTVTIGMPPSTVIVVAIFSELYFLIPPRGALRCYPRTLLVRCVCIADTTALVTAFVCGGAPEITRTQVCSLIPSRHSTGALR